MPGPSRALAQAWYMLFILCIAYILSFVDRQIMSLLVGPIRVDLKLTDTGVSLLHGFAFAIFYTLVGIPLAGVAERGNRVLLIVAGVVVWSIATVACGLAQSFAMLFLFRIFVGAGEAALNPAAYSLIGERFPPHWRGRAFGIFHIAGSIGAGVALLFGGAVVGAVGGGEATILPVVGVVRPWQLVFMICGAPGILIAVVILLNLRDERPWRFSRSAQELTEKRPALLRETRPFLPLFLGSSAFAAFGLGLLAWAPTFFVRTHGWTMAEAGMVLGSMIVAAGAIGPLAGGWAHDRLGRSGADGAVLIIRTLAVLALAPGIGAFLMPSAAGSLVLIGIAYMLFTAHIGLVPAAIQAAAPEGVKARLSAIWLCLFNLIGFGGGPLLVALLTDYLLADPALVGYALAIAAGLTLVLVRVAVWRWRDPPAASPIAS